MSTSKAFATIMVIIVVIGTYLALTMALDIREYWSGFLFLFCWGTIEMMKIDRLGHTVIGAAGGIALASIPIWLTPMIGVGWASAVMLAAIGLCTFALLRSWATLLCNAPMMLFLTVATIPHIASHAAPVDIYAGLASGVIYFGGLALIVTRIMAWRSAPLSAV